MMRMTSVWCAALCAVLCVLFISHHAIAQQTQQLTDEQLFDPNHVIDIRITLPAEDWDTIRLQTRSFVGSLTMGAPVSPFTYVRGDIEIDGVLIKDVGIRKKGFLGSLNDQRPSLKIRFDKYIDQDPIRGVDRLTLNNNNQDPARLSQFLGYQLFIATGSPAPRCSKPMRCAKPMHSSSRPVSAPASSTPRRSPLP